jgi:hypothetical protein
MKDSCKICYREYEDRPNDMCDNYLHWQAYVYKLEISPNILQWEERDVMLQIEGKSFRCECGCNVFRKELNGTLYKCNACGSLYNGED